VKKAFGLWALGVSVLVLSQACGSDEPKKADPKKFSPDDDGAGGGDGSGGTNAGATAGSSGSGVGATSGEGAGGELLAIGDTLYFNRNVNTDPKNGIYRFRTGDANPTLVVSAEDVNTMVVDSEYVYYASQNVTGIFKAPLTGGAGVQISDGNWTRIVGQEGKFVYAYGYGVNHMYKIIK
jgi:hypothetical protein